MNKLIDLIEKELNALAVEECIRFFSDDENYVPKQAAIDEKQDALRERMAKRMVGALDPRKGY